MWLANLVFTAISSCCCLNNAGSAYDCVDGLAATSVSSSNDPYWEQGSFFGDNYQWLDEPLCQRNNFLTYYFSHLTEHFPQNVWNSCGYLACAMYLMYLDTFWDDNIVDSVYESYSVSELEYGYDDSYFLPFDATSPGCLNETSLGEGENEKDYYENIVLKHKGDSLQFLLISEYILGVLAGNLNLGFRVFDTDIYEILHMYLVNYKGYKITDFDFFSNSEDHEDIDDYLSYTDFIKKYIDMGIPVLCTVKNSDGKHVVIAYDYDETTGEIYYHWGWHEVGTYHRTLHNDGDDSYDEITSVFIVRPKFPCQYPKKYYARKTNGEVINLGWESLALSSGIKKVSGDNDSPATFVAEKWFVAGPVMSEDYSGGIVFFDYLMGWGKSFPLDNGVLTLTQAEWDFILKMPADYFYAAIYIKKTNSPIIQYGTTVKFFDPKPYEPMLHFDAADFGFTNEYCKFSTNSEYLLNGNFQVGVSRLRTGYIENSFINLSPRRAGYGESYLELTWNKPIYGILIGLAKWNDEFYINDDTECYIDLLDADGSWKSEIDLLNDLTLPIKRYGFLRLNISVSEGCYGIKIVNNSEAIGSRNLNRLSIDQIVFAQRQTETFPYVNF